MAVSRSAWEALKWLGLVLGAAAAALFGAGLALSAGAPVLQAGLLAACAVLWVAGAFKTNSAGRGAAEAAVGLALLAIVAGFVRGQAQGPYFRKVRWHAALIRKLPQAKACSGLPPAEREALTPQLKAALLDADPDVRAGAEHCLVLLGVSTGTIVFPGNPGP